MIASFRADNLKMRKRLANWILFGILVGAMALLLYILLYVAIVNSPRGGSAAENPNLIKRTFFPENLVPYVLRNSSSIGAAILIIFGALSTASEYGWLTIQTILIQGPGRSAVLAGKLLALAIGTLVMCIAALGACAAAAAVVVAIDGSASRWPALTILLKGFGALLLELSVWTGFGMFLGIAFRSTAAAIGGGLTYLFVGETLIGGLLRNTPVIKDILRFLPGVNASAVNGSFAWTTPAPGAGADLVDATRGLITLLIYLGVFVALSFVLFRRRDVGA